MKAIKYNILGLILFSLFAACDNVDDFIDQHTEGGPIIYAGKVNKLEFQSGYNRIKANIYPVADVNRDHCILSWNVTNEVKDSLIVDYSKAAYDDSLECYSVIIDLSEDKIQGSLLVEAQNVDAFGNKSLIEEKGAFVYGVIYESTLINDGVRFNEDADVIIFNRKVGSVGNYVSYEKTDGSFTPEVLCTDEQFAMQDNKVGGLVKNKTRFLIKETDIDTLEVNYYSEVEIPLPSFPVPAVLDFCNEQDGAEYFATNAVDGIINSSMWHTGWSNADHLIFHNEDNYPDASIAHYIVLDYKKNTTLKSITVHNDANKVLKTVNVWVSTDTQYIENSDKGTDQSVVDYWRIPHENSWTQVGTLNFTNADASKTFDLPAPVDFRLIMLTMPDSHAGNKHIRISEIEVEQEW
ncbi:MAG: DUF4998 domain-containing protein [Alphaproteobacteria bacterium]